MKQPMFLLVFLLMMVSQLTQALESIAKVSFVRGNVAAISNEKGTRLLGKGLPLYSGDNIETSPKSFVMIVFNDGSKVTIRPSSRFSLNDYQVKQGKASTKTELHEGGVHVNSRDNQFQIKTSLATVNTQKSEYSVRLCQQDCNPKRKKINQEALHHTVIAKVVKIKGKIRVKNTDKKLTQRVLTLKSPLYEGDYLMTAPSSYAVLVFRDGGRVTVDEKTEYQINEYQYQTKKETFIQTLFKGGLRILTGTIGKINQEAYQLKTPVATIGIRGTGFDVRYIKKCQKEAVCFQQKEGLFSQVWHGSIVQKNKITQAILDVSKASYIANQHSAIVALSTFPAYITPNNTIRPDRVKIDEKMLFTTASVGEISDGLYVTVHEGAVNLDVLALKLKENEQAYVNLKGEVSQIDKPVLTDEDFYPLPSKFDQKKAEIQNYSLLKKQKYIQINEDYQCTPK
jgi:hypothetical protein